MNLQEILQKVRSLPPMSSTAVRLMGVIGDPNTQVSEIAEVLRYDTAITGQMLKLCNSAAFGLTRRVASIDDALIYLGRSKTLGIVTMLHTSGLLNQAQKGYGLEPRMLWKHSVGVALASEWLGQKIKSHQQAWSFTAGLLHDIGKLILNEFLTEAVIEITEVVRVEGLSFDKAEHKILGYSSNMAGAILAEHWQLPEPIVNTIRHHLNPLELDTPDALVDTVYLANCVSMMLGIGVGDDGLFYRTEPAIVSRYGLRDEDFEECGMQTICSLIEIERQFASPPAADATAKPRRSLSAGARS